jgi:hypothetical protein
VGVTTAATTTTIAAAATTTTTTTTTTAAAQRRRQQQQQQQHTQRQQLAPATPSKMQAMRHDARLNHCSGSVSRLVATAIVMRPEIPAQHNAARGI